MKDTIVLKIPLNVKKVSGRVLVLAPTELNAPPEDGLDRYALRAVATAFHWQEELANGKYRSQRALARAKCLHYSVVARQLKLVFLDPFIIRQLLRGHQPSGFSIYRVMDNFPMGWEEQKRRFGFG